MGHSPHAWTVARRRRAGHQPHPADDLRDLPELPVPPGGRGPEGRDAADPVRRPVHPRPGRGGEPQRARRRRRAGRRPTSARRCWSRRCRSSASSSTATATPTSAASTSTSSPRSSGTCPRSGCRSASPSPASSRASSPASSADVMIAVEPEAELGELFDAAGGAGKPRIGPDADQLRHRQGRRGHPGAQRCSAGSASAGRSTPSCPGRRPSTPPASSSARRTSPAAIPCGDDVDAVLEAAKEYADAGFTHLALVQIGGDQQQPYHRVEREDPDAGLAGRVRQLTGGRTPWGEVTPTGDAGAALRPRSSAA